MENIRYLYSYDIYGEPMDGELTIKLFKHKIAKEHGRTYSLHCGSKVWKGTLKSTQTPTVYFLKEDDAIHHAKKVIENIETKLILT